MSRDAAVGFLSRLGADPALMQRLGESPTADAYVSLGRGEGHDFSAEELTGVLAARRFYAEALRDPQIRDRMWESSDEAEVVALANRLGFDCGLDDLQAVLRGIAAEEELSDTEMEEVVGGMFPGSTNPRQGFSFPDVCLVPESTTLTAPLPYPTTGFPT
jgi:predicted ribosomally synthesized peptide with nif11-like leader